MAPAARQGHAATGLSRARLEKLQLLDYPEKSDKTMAGVWDDAIQRALSNRHCTNFI